MARHSWFPSSYAGQLYQPIGKPSKSSSDEQNQRSDGVFVLDRCSYYKHASVIAQLLDPTDKHQSVSALEELFEDPQLFTHVKNL